MIKQSVIERELRAIRAEIPEIKCQRKCEYYCGPIGMTKLEQERIEAITKTPLQSVPLNAIMTHGDYLAIEERAEALVFTGCIQCPMLKDGNVCSVYHERPIICRVWGITKDMRCPYGCEPSRWLTRNEVYAIMSRMDDLSKKVSRNK